MDTSLKCNLQKLAGSVPELLKFSIEDCLNCNDPSNIAESFLTGSLKNAIKLKLEESLLIEICELAGECLQTLSKTSHFSSALKINRNCYHFFIGGLGLSNSSGDILNGVLLKSTLELLKHFCDFLSLTIRKHDDIQKDFLVELSSVVDNLSRLSLNLALTLSKATDQVPDLTALLFVYSFRFRCMSSRMELRSLINCFQPISHYHKNSNDTCSVFNEGFDDLVTSSIQHNKSLQKAVPVIDLLSFFISWVDFCFRQQIEYSQLSTSISFCRTIFFEKFDKEHLVDCFNFFNTLWDILKVSTSVSNPNNKVDEESGVLEENVKSWVSVLQAESGSSLCKENILLKIVSFITRWFVTLPNVLRELPSDSLKLHKRTLLFLPLVQWTMEFLQLSLVNGKMKTNELPVSLFRGYAHCFYYIYKENTGSISEQVMCDHIHFFRTWLYSDIFLPQSRICEVLNILGNIALLLTKHGSLASSALLDSSISVIETHARLYGLEKCGIPEPQKTVSRMYSRLALNYRYLGFHSRGLEALAQLLVHLKGSDQEELLQKWIQLKRLIYASPSLIHLRRRSVVQQLKVMNCSLSDEASFQLLNAELCCYRKNGIGLEEEIFSVTADIISEKSNCKVDKAMAVVDHCKAARILRWKSKWKLDDLCQEAVDTLDNESIDPATFNSPVRQLYISFGCYELYIQKSQQLKDCIRKSGVSRLKTTWIKPVPKGDEEPSSSCDIQASLRHVTLASGTECLRPLDKSLLALQHAIKSTGTFCSNWDWAKEAVEPKLMISHAFVLGENFLLAQRMEQCMSCFIQLYHLGASMKDQEIQFQALCRLTSLLSRAGLPWQALLLVPSMQPASPCLKLQCHLAKAEALFYCGEFQEAFDLLLNTMDKLHTAQDMNYPRSLVKVLEVEAHFLLVHFHLLSTPSLKFLSSKEVQKTYLQSSSISALLQQPPITVALDALKLCIKLYKSQHCSHSFDVSDAGWKASGLKLCIERLLLEGASLVGQLYMHQGEVHEPRNVLLEYLAVAQEQAAMLWSAELLVCLAELDLLSHNPGDCMVKCQGLFYLLSEKELSPVTSANESTPTSSPQVTSPFPDFLKQDSEMYPEVDTSNDKEDSLPLFSSPEKSHFLKCRCEQVHTRECTCERCGYAGVDINVLWARKLQSECMAYSADPNSCYQELTIVYNELQTLMSKSVYRLQRLQDLAKGLAKPLNIKPKEFEIQTRKNKNIDVKLLNFILRVKLSMAECLIQMHNPKESLSFLEDSLMEIQKVNGLATMLFPSLYASLIFLKCLAKLHIFAFEHGQTFVSCFKTCHTCESDETVTELSKLINNIKISDMQVATESPPPLHSISNKNKKFKVPNAPLKKGKGIVINSDSKSVSVTSEHTLHSNKTLGNPLQSIESVQTSAKTIALPVCTDIKVTCNLKAEELVNTRVPKKSSKMPTTAHCNTVNSVISTNSFSEMTENNKLITLTPDNPTASKLGRRRELVNLSNIQLHSVTENAKVTETSSEPVEKRVLRNREKPSLSEKFEVLKAARKSRRKLREQKENIEVDCTIDDSPETMRSGRRNIKASRVPQTRRQINVNDSESEKLEGTTCLLTVPSDEEDNLEPSNKSERISKEQVPSSLAECEEVLKSVKEDLCDALTAISHHPPSLIYSKLTLLLAMIENSIQSKDDQRRHLQTAYYLSQSVGLTLRHQSLYYLQKRISTGESSEYMERLTSLKSSDKARQEILSFQPWQEEAISEIMKGRLDLIPEDWTVVQVNGARVWHSMKHLKLNKTPDLIIGRYTSNTSPVVALVAAMDSQLRKGFLKEFADMMEMSVINGKEQRPKVWWTHRFNLDKRMENLCKSMETVWLGCWKCLFLGKPVNEEYAKGLQEAVTTFLHKTRLLGLQCENENMLKCFLDGVASAQLDQKQVCSGLLYLFGQSVFKQKPVLSILQSLELQKLPPTERKPLILVLDKMVHQLPWENMPFLKNCPVTRMPSLDFLLSQLMYHSEPNTESVFLKGVNEPKTFYLLNPSRDLLRTEAFFKEKLTLIPDWKGLASEVPTKEQVLAAVVDYDCYLYIGHGSGRVYLCKELVQSYPCRAVVILMGCSSVKLKTVGCFEPSGVVLQYLMGGCPAVLGNLWDVTDKDIDQFTDILIKKWLRGESGTQMNRALMEGRLACKLKSFTGAAPVIYGLPVYKC